MNQNKSSIDFPLAEAFEKTINTMQCELLANELHRKMIDYFWEWQRPDSNIKSTPHEDAVYFTFSVFSFILTQFIEYEDYEPLFIRCQEIIKKIIAEKVTDHEAMPEYQKLSQDVKEFMGRMIDSPKYRDRFKSFPEGFD